MIAAVVIVSPIAILFTIRLIMFLIETNAVAQGEAIVGGDQVHRRSGLATVTRKEIAGRSKTPGKLTQ